MKAITINKRYAIQAGVCDGMIGKVVGFDSIEDEVTIELDDITHLLISSEYLEELEA